MTDDEMMKAAFAKPFVGAAFDCAEAAGCDMEVFADLALARAMAIIVGTDPDVLATVLAGYRRAALELRRSVEQAKALLAAAPAGVG